MLGEVNSEYLRRLPRGMVANAERILAAKDVPGGPVETLDPDHYTVAPLRGFRRVKVYRRGDVWRCATDDENNQDRPCSHILAVFIATGQVPHVPVWRKGDSPRNHRLEAQAWEAVPARVPALLAKLLRQALPVLAPEPEPNPRGGRGFKPVFPQVYQAILGTLFRKSLRCGRGEMRTGDHLEHNPWGPVGIATLSRFRCDPTRLELLEKLLALSTWPARPYETLAHPDGTGLTEQHFSSYYDERYAKDRAKKARMSRKRRVLVYLPVVPPDADDVATAVVEAERVAVAAAVAFEVERHAQGLKPREHHWSYAEILWTYRYTLVAAIHTAQEQFGEAPWFIPLMERARLMLALREFGGDKAYDSNDIFRYAKAHGLDAQVKIRRTPVPTYSHAGKKYRKAKLLESRIIDRRGYALRANRRNNAETGNHAFKAIVGSEIYSRGKLNSDGSRDFTSRQSEVLCMCIAYNLTRLVYLEVEQGIEADFAQGVSRLASRRWQSLKTLRERFS